ncbi:MAG TPA: CpsB/CapC family capsule biosynthesis tyrosine phosphatase [Acidobacteriota bacterium]
MIDLHGHYLPAVDDGAADMATSLAMLRTAEKDGIMTAVATPHACGSTCKLRDLDALGRKWEKWRAQLKKSDLQIKVIGGAEVYFTSELLSILRDHRELLTINNSSYFLLEFPADYVYAHSKDFIFKILTDGYIPIISHAERNSEIQRSPEVLRDLVKAGALCQVNAGSLRGDFGNAARQSAFELIQGNLVHVIASDAHDLESRKPELAYVPALLHNVDPIKIELYLNGIPEAIIADQAVPDIGEPLRHRQRSSFFDLFKKRDS